MEEGAGRTDMHGGSHLDAQHGQNESLLRCSGELK